MSLPRWQMQLQLLVENASCDHLVAGRGARQAAALASLRGNFRTSSLPRGLTAALTGTPPFPRILVLLRLLRQLLLHVLLRLLQERALQGIALPARVAAVVAMPSRRKQAPPPAADRNAQSLGHRRQEDGRAPMKERHQIRTGKGPGSTAGGRGQARSQQGKNANPAGAAAEAACRAATPPACAPGRDPQAEALG